MPLSARGTSGSGFGTSQKLPALSPRKTELNTSGATTSSSSFAQLAQAQLDAPSRRGSDMSTSSNRGSDGSEVRGKLVRLRSITDSGLKNPPMQAMSPINTTTNSNGIFNSHNSSSHTMLHHSNSSNAAVSSSAAVTGHRNTISTQLSCNAITTAINLNFNSNHLNNSNNSSSSSCGNNNKLSPLAANQNSAAAASFAFEDAQAAEWTDDRESSLLKEFD